MEWKNYIGICIILFTLIGYFGFNVYHSAQIDSPIDLKSTTGYKDPFVKPTNTMLGLVFGYVLYFALAGGFIGCLAFITQIHRFKLFLIIITLFILFIAYVMPTEMIHGRYLDPLIPLLIIGALGFSQVTMSQKFLLYGFAIITLSTWFFPFFCFDIVNSASNLYLLIPYIQYISIGLIFLALLVIVFVKSKTTRSIICIILLLTFIASGVVNYYAVLDASSNAYDSCMIGRYLADNSILSVSFDEDDIESYWASYCLMNYWIREFIPVTDLDNSTEYFISSKQLEYEVLIDQKGYSQFEDQTNQLFLYIKTTQNINNSICIY